MKYHSEGKLPKTEKSINVESVLWNIEDLSDYLNVKVKTIYSMVPDIPHYRIGKLIRFKKDEIDNWLESKRAKVHQTMQVKKPREATNHIDLLIRKTIDQAKQEDYNSSHGKSDRIKTQAKEMNYGSL